jgi:hypothetical protein
LGHRAERIGDPLPPFLDAGKPAAERLDSLLGNVLFNPQTLDQGGPVAAIEHRAEEALLALRVHIIRLAAVARLDLFVGRAGENRHAEQGVNLPAGDQLGA